MRTRAKLAAVVAAACLLVGGLTVASAAQLGVDGGSLSTATAGPCSSGLTVTREGFQFFDLIWNRARVTYPAACREKVVQIGGAGWLGGAATGSTVLGAGSGDITATVTLSSPVWSWSGVDVVVDGWQIPATTVNP